MGKRKQEEIKKKVRGKNNSGRENRKKETYGNLEEKIHESRNKIREIRRLRYFAHSSMINKLNNRKIRKKKLTGGQETLPILLSGRICNLIYKKEKI